MSKTLKVGLAGVGGISGAHIPAWLSIPEVELVAICDIRPEQMQKYPDIRQYMDFDTMLDKEQLDILDICLPTYLHADFSVKAMERKINVICEKPVSLKKQDVSRVYETAKRNDVKFMVAQVLRFWPEYELVKKIYDDGRYGKLLSGSMTRLGMYPSWSWDSWMMDENRSGLVPFDLHIHDLDFMVYAFGSPQEQTTFRSRKPDQDYINAVYEYDGFFIVTEASWYASPYPFSAQFRFQFENAVLDFKDGRLKIYERKGNTIDCSVEANGQTGDINLPKSDAYANEIRYFTDCVLNGIKPDKVQPRQLETVLDLLQDF